MADGGRARGRARVRNDEVPHLLGGDQPLVQLWDLTSFTASTTRAFQRACAMVDRGLERDEWNDHVKTAAYRPTC
ncbi:hypothetical protein E1264_05410 [Actinomadura sp. KC216]|uniref:hypothetical protein n=1 Tax=Actinomadura sp. KC216 TaxID=2530370 RepID=UPI00104CA5E8|nr:hypothetical protein [Actinomadura sp. KC216]TDB90320.1 hypothetical protein E1264_05410 [Actinomadura sp. KC216]